MATSKTPTKSAWKDGFLFVGNHLALDFLNTHPVHNGQAQELLPDFSALLRWFQAAGLLGPAEVTTLRQRWESSARARQTLQTLRKLREQLRTDVAKWEAGGAIDGATLKKLNAWMVAHPVLEKLTRVDHTLALRSWFEVRQPEDLIAPLAHSAARLFVEVDRSRARKCDQCVLHFLDTSKKGTRRWCSMQLCGNRVKVAAYADRRRRRSNC